MLRKLSLENCKQLAKQRNGICLSLDYKNNHTKLLWQRPIGMKKWDWFHKEHLNSELWDKKKLKEMSIL